MHGAAPILPEPSVSVPAARRVRRPRYASASDSRIDARRANVAQTPPSTKSLEQIAGRVRDLRPEVEERQHHASPVSRPPQRERDQPEIEAERLDLHRRLAALPPRSMQIHRAAPVAEVLAIELREAERMGVPDDHVRRVLQDFARRSPSLAEIAV